MLGAVEKFHPQHQVSGDTGLALGRLSTVLEWTTQDHNSTGKGPFMSSAIVRGTPYTSMLYMGATPKLTVQRAVVFAPEIDNDTENKMECGRGDEGTYGPPIMVHKEIKVHFDSADFTWLIFVSEPTEFECWTRDDPSDMSLPPGVEATGPLGAFELRATSPMKYGMIRIALGNNCTTGQNAECK